MSDAPNKIQWHPAFFAAAGLEFREDADKIELTREYQLSKEPLRIDVLLLKKIEGFKIKNELGHIMRTYNVIEYKSPDDGLTIDDYYKTIAYAFFYKSLGETVNAIPLKELTASLFRENKPRELFKELEKDGRVIKNKYPGIYYIEGESIPVQVVVIKELSPELHSSLRILSNNAKDDDVKRFLEESLGLKEQGDRNNIDAVLQASVSANMDLYEEIRRNTVMCQALEVLMKDVIDNKYNLGMDLGMNLGMNNGQAKQIVKLGSEFGLSKEEILTRLVDSLTINVDDAAKYYDQYAPKSLV